MVVMIMMIMMRIMTMKMIRIMMPMKVLIGDVPIKNKLAVINSLMFQITNHKSQITTHISPTDQHSLEK